MDQLRFGQLLSSSAEEDPTEYVHTVNVSMSVCACGSVCLRARNDDGGAEQKKITVCLCGKLDIFCFFSICLSSGYYYPILHFLLLFSHLCVCLVCMLVSVLCVRMCQCFYRCVGFVVWYIYMNTQYVMLV